MATTLNVIKTITIRGTTEGVSEVERRLAGLTAGMEQVTLATGKQEKAVLSVENAYKRLQTRYDQEFRAQQELAKAQKTLEAARAQGLITQQRQSELMRLAIQQHNTSASSVNLHQAALQELNTAAIAASSSLGTLGAILVRMGPAGIAVGAAFGVAATALGGMVHEALRLADVSGQLKDLSETTGFTVEQLQALQTAGARVGINAQEMSTALTRFTFNLNAAHEATGELYKAIRQVNPGLATQLVQTQDAAEAYDVLVRALNEAATAEQRVAIARAAGGRGAAGLTRLAREGDITALMSQLRTVDTITTQQAEKWDDLGDSIAESLRKARNNFASTFTPEILSIVDQIATKLIDMSRALKEATVDPSLTNFIALLKTVDPNTAREITSIVDFFRKGLHGFTDDSNEASAAIKRTQDAMKTLGDEAGGAGRLISGGANSVQEWRDHVKSTEGVITGFNRRIIENAVKQKEWVASLQGTATPLEQLRAKLAEVDAEQAKDNITAAQAEEARKRLNAEFSRSRASAEAAAIGQAATVTEQYRQAVQRLQDQFDRGEIGREALLRGIRGLASEEVVSALERNVSTLGDLATEAEKTEAAVARLNLQFERKEITVDTLNRRLADMNPILKNLNANVGDFLNTFIQGMVRGESATKSLQSALTALGSAITSSAIKDIGNIIAKSLSGSIAGSLGGAAFAGGGGAGPGGVDLFGGAGLGGIGTLAGSALGGPLVGAAIGVGISLLSKLFDDSAEKAEEAAAAQAKQAEIQKRQTEDAARMAEILRQQEIELTNIAALTQQAYPTTELQTRINALAKAWSDATVAATTLGRSTETLTAYTELYMAALTKLRDDIIDDLQRSINELEGRGFINEIADIVKKVNEARDALSQLPGGADETTLSRFLQLSVQRIIDQNKLVGESYQELLMRYPELIGLVHEYNAALLSEADAREVAAAALERQRTLEDRLLTVRTDASTLEGQLILFDRKAQREREEEAKAGGQNLALLEQVLAEERAKIVKDFRQKVVDEEKRAADERVKALNSAAKQILDYVKGLMTGPQGGLSPQQQFQNAQAVYQKTLQLAQQGNVDALNRIASEAEAYRVAARQMFGSNQQYQNILNQITQDLLGLPAVQEANDPVVKAIREEIAILQSIDRKLGTQVPVVAAQMGGWITKGSPTRDSTLLFATQGEFVVNRASAARYGGLLEAINDNALPAYGGGNEEVVTELRALRRDIMRGFVASSENVREGVDEVAGAMSTIAREAQLKQQAS